MHVAGCAIGELSDNLCLLQLQSSHALHTVFCVTGGGQLRSATLAMSPPTFRRWHTLWESFRPGSLVPMTTTGLTRAGQ